MIRILCTACLILFPCFVFAQSGKNVFVPIGDEAALRQAILDANKQPLDFTTVIVIGGDYLISAANALPPIEGNIVIRGLGIFRPQVGEAAQLFHIAAGATLGLINVEIRDFSLKQSLNGLIENFGTLEFRRVQFSSVASDVNCNSRGCSQSMPAITNHPTGHIQMHQVSFVDSGGKGPDFAGPRTGLIVNEGRIEAANIQLYESPEPWFAPLSNSGSVLFVNSSFKRAGISGTSGRNLISHLPGGSAEFHNSVFAGFSGEWCQQATSLGYNLNDAANCGWNNEADLVGVPAGLLWRSAAASWGNSGWLAILTHALIPSAASAAIDSGNAGWCPAPSLLDNGGRLKDGNGDGVGGCDRGAVELSPIGLEEGGINGFWFDPNADGHYLYVLENDFNTLVMWTTFDAEGHQLWVYGTGELKNGRSLIAKVYINRNGKVNLDGNIEPADDEHWGWLEVDMTSCTEGEVGFRSDLPEFGSGQFSIQRLAYVKQLGCIDL